MVLIIDPQIAGISGDMLLSSLIDLGADKNRVLSGISKSAKFLSNSTIEKIDFEQITKHGVQSFQLILEVNEGVHERKGSEIKKAISNSVMEIGLSQKAKSFAESCIDTLISSESKIHGISEESVHFHEASGIDTLVDIVGISIALDDLELFDERIICLPVSVGGGSVTFSHGTMSNPAGAILEIFKNSDLMIRGNNANDELTTPTGACILVNLVHESVKFYPLMTIGSVGYGAGQKNFESFSNVLKIVRGIENDFETDSVKVLETNVDDVSGEILGNLIEKIMGKNALDVSICPGITKKGRPTNCISVICSHTNVDEILDVLVLETGTLGIRIFDSNRFIVPRITRSADLIVQDSSFRVNYKEFSFKDKTGFKIEFDDLKKVSDSLDKSIRETDALLRKEIDQLRSCNDDQSQ